MARHSLVLALSLAALGWSQTSSPDELAYRAIRAQDWDAAIVNLTVAIRAAPGRAALHKDLAYTYLKIGDTVSARDRFAEAMRLDPADLHVDRKSVV